MSLRILHCPTTVGGNPSGLASAERTLGLHSWAVTIYQNQFNYPMDEVLATPATSVLQREMKRWGLLWRALRQYDLVHFNFGRTISPMPGEGDAVAHPIRGPLFRL